MTLTPSVRAISLCSFPCVARPFARASFVAISALECLLFPAISFAPYLHLSLYSTRLLADKGVDLSAVKNPISDGFELGG